MFLLVGAIAAYSAPIGPDGVEIGNSGGKLQSTSGVPVAAEAGNVTNLNLNASRQSYHWQGYYGNVSGSIVLDDANNYSMYSWGLLPVGEVYAVNDSAEVSWSRVYCINLSAPADSASDFQKFNESLLEASYGIGINERDGIGETFNETYGSASGFKVGTVTINSQSYCRMTYTYVNQAYQTGNFPEFLMTDNQSIIFTTLLEPGIAGYDGNKWDFQMIVPVDSSIQAFNYYFYLEIE